MKKRESLDLDLHTLLFTRLSLSLDKELNLVAVIIFIYNTWSHGASKLSEKNLFLYTDRTQFIGIK